MTLLAVIVLWCLVAIVLAPVIGRTIAGKRRRPSTATKMPHGAEHEPQAAPHGRSAGGAGHLLS